MKKLGLFALTGTLLFGGLISTTSCGFFGSDAYTISDVTSKLNSDGTTTVTIKFSEEANVPDYNFTLPKGEDGKGVKDVKTTPNKENTGLDVLITFTDDTTYSFTLPIVNGKDGNGIDNITEGVTPEGNKTLIITYTDPKREPTVVTIPKGETGKGIKDITYFEDPQTHEFTVTITYTDEQTVVIPLPRPNGISKVEASIDPLTGNVILNFTLTSGEKLEPVVVGRTTVWHTGKQAPSKTIGYDGDFYFNTDTLIIYNKVNGEWVIVIDFKNSMEQDKFNVTFNLNTSDPNASFNGHKDTYLVPANKNFYYLNISVPTPIRSGFRFDGWYTEAEYNVNLGRFTNLTPVYSNMTLFANWVSL